MTTTGPVAVSTSALLDESQQERAEREEEMLALKLMLVQQIRRVAEQYRLFTPDDLEDAHGIGRQRRARRRAAEDTLATVELVDVGDTLLWQPSQTGLPELAERRARLASGAAHPRHEGAPGRDAPPPRRQLLARFLFLRMPEEGLAAHVRRWDEAWFGTHQLRRWNPADGSWTDGAPLPPAGPVLLLVPGTFVSGTFMLAQLAGTPAGQAFLADVADRYAGVYAFKHPVLATTPAMNGAALAERFRDHALDVDVIAHGSGGAVVRWWRDAFGGAGGARVRAVLVGAPLEGTALAAPGALLSAPSVLTCVAAGLLARAGVERATDHESRRTPTDKAIDRLLRLSLLLLRVRTSVASPDPHSVQSEVAAAMLPGWLAQAAVIPAHRAPGGEEVPARHRTAEAELLARLAVRADTEYHVVGSEFVGGGPLWSLATQLTAPNRGSQPPPDWAAAALTPPSADGSLVGRSNDLLVEGASTAMIGGAPLSPARTLHFAPCDRVHHLNYLEHADTIRYLRAAFALGA